MEFARSTFEYDGHVSSKTYTHCKSFNSFFNLASVPLQVVRAVGAGLVRPRPCVVRARSVEEEQRDPCRERGHELEAPPSPATHSLAGARECFNLKGSCCWGSASRTICSSTTHKLFSRLQSCQCGVRCVAWRHSARGTDVSRSGQVSPAAWRTSW